MTAKPDRQDDEDFLHPGSGQIHGQQPYGHRAFRENNTSILITDLIGWIESYDKLRAKATAIDLVFPGHDMSMAKDFPKVAEDVTRLV
jgi:hypothetical protein